MSPFSGNEPAQGAARTASLIQVDAWSASDRGVLVLPSGRMVRGRGLRGPMPDGPMPDFGLYLDRGKPHQVSWNVLWIRWPDFWLPANRGDAHAALCL